MEHDRDANSVPSFDTEAEIDEVILRLDLTLVRPDDDEPTPLQSADSALPSSTDTTQTQNGGTQTTSSSSRTSDFNGVRTTGGKSEANNSNNSQHDDDKKKSKPLDFIRKLRQTGHQTDSHRNGGASDSGGRRKSPEPLKVRLYTPVIMQCSSLSPYSITSILQSHRK